MKKMFLLCILLSCLQQVQAQKTNGIIRGTLQDSASSTFLADATVSVVRLSDSSLISFSLTDTKGRFEIKNLDAGSYYVVSSFTGLQTFKKNFVISAGNPIIEMGLIKMERFYKTLEGVVITEAPVRINGDTISYRADAFKTKPNATVEDLLKKLPGVQVERDGTVKAQGENVQKVYVDGKEFFNSDPKLATKNLTAEMVDQVEVFDDMSEQAKFSRIDDGSRTKAINLKLKKDKKKGVFGKAYAGAGRPGERFDMGLNANIFKGATQTYVFAKNNNTNNIGFTVSDIVGTMGMGALSAGGMGMGGGMSVSGRGMMGGGGSTGSFSGGTNSGGITKSSNVGINYRDTWSKFFEVNGSYSFNHTNTGNERISNSKTFYPDSTRLQDAFSNSRRQNDNHRINMNVVYTIDSFNSIIYNPNFNYQKTFNTFSRDSLDIGFEKEAGGSYLANKILSLTNTTGDGYNFTNNLIWRRKFRR
ncbi:MAG: carboxypeptidase-like regulatory domain-containing protein, partial [Bacteroidota bacterium]